MKRKDWKINSLKEGIYGKVKKVRINRRIFFLRKLIFRKHKTLIKRNLILNYHFFSNFLINMKLLKKFHWNFIFSTNKNNLTYFPDFLFKKKLTNLFVNFKRLQKNSNFSYFFLKTHNNSKGTNMYLFNLKNEEFFDASLLNDDNKGLLSKKLQFLENTFETNYNFNYYFSFNMNMNSSLEIYKILIYLYLYNLNKHQNK